MARRRRRGWPGPLAAARIHGCPDVVATMWILLVLFGAMGGVLCYPPWGAAPVPPEPVQVMTDVTNHLGVALLQDFACLPGNVAFSPYGAASVLIVLWEGARGESGVQLRKALGLPSTSHPTLDYGVIRLGMRDIHRHLRTYFAHDGYLNGLAFGNASVASFKPSFRQILRFYGYDPDTAMTGGGEMVTPPWMNHMTSTTPFNEQTSTTSVANTTDTAMESKTENTTTPTTTISLTIPSTLSSPPTTKPIAVLTVAPKPTTPMSTTAKPAKTTKSPKITTQNATLANTTGINQSDATVKPSTLPDDVTSTILSTPPTENAVASTTTTNATTSPSTPNTGTTLKDFKDPSMSALTDIADFTSSTRVTRRMPSSETATELETIVSTIPTTTTPISDETSTIYESITSTTENVEVAIPSDVEAYFTPTVPSTENNNTPTLSSMLTALSSGKTSDSGFTTTFILMTMTTQNLQQANLTAMLPQSLNLVTNNQIIPQDITTPIPPEPSTAQPTAAESIQKTTSPYFLTSTSESFPSTFFTTTSPTTIEESDEREMSAEVTSERTLTEETMSTERDEDFMYSTTPEYMTTTYSSDNMVESETTSSDGDVILSTSTISPDVLTTTDTSEDEMSTTEAKTVTEEASTQVSSSPEPLDEEAVPKSRKKRLSEGENNFFPEIQLHLHGNAMLNADDKDMDTMWQTYQEKFGLPLGPFQVLYQGQEPTVKWIPMIRMVKRLPFAYISRLQAQVLMLPLDDERYKLLLMLPVEDNIGYEGWRPSRQKRNYPFQSNGPQDQSLLRLIEDLRSVPLREIVSSVQPCLVAATIPPFLIRGLLDLTPSLARMGVKDVFDTKTADLSGMSNDTNLWVRGVEQTVSVAVDINGIFGRNRGGGRQEDHRAFRRHEDWSNYHGHPISLPHQRRDASQGHWGSSQSEGERVDGHFMVTRSFLFFVVDTSTRVALMAGKVIDPTSTKNS